MEDPINGAVDIELDDVENGDALVGGIPPMDYSLDTEKYEIVKVMPDVILAEYVKPDVEPDKDGMILDEKTNLYLKAETKSDGIWKVLEVKMVGVDVKNVNVGDFIVTANEGSGLKVVDFDGTEFAMTREENVMYIVKKK